MPASSRLFLSYARMDAREFALRLHRDLSADGYDCWLDTVRLKGSPVWTREIERALDRSDVVLALLSRAAFHSEICRAEQLRSLRNRKCLILLLVQRDADCPLHLETRHFFDFSDPLCYAETYLALRAAIGDRNGVPLPERYRRTYITAPPLPVNFIERREVLEVLREAVLSEQTPRHIAVTALRGMGGIGKTVLAQALCHDEVVQAAFPDGVIWVPIGQQPGDLVRQMREVAKALNEPIERYDTPEGCVNQLRTTLRDQAVLLVLDDVWDVRHIQPFRAEAPRCRLLFTTRDARLAAAIGAQEHILDVLTGEQSLALLARWANESVETLPPEAAEVVRECGHLPLALAMAGAMVRGKPNRWANLLHRLRHADLDKIQQPFPDYPHRDLLRTLQVSVDALDPPMRARYLELAVFPDDTPIPEAPLEILWGVDTSEAQETMDLMADLSLATRAPRDCLMLHDLQLDYVRKQVGAANLPALHGRLLEAYGDRRDAYLYERVAYHLVSAARQAELRRLLLDFDWLQSKLQATNPHALITDCDYLPEDADVRLIQGAIRLSSHVIGDDKGQFAGQLLGRLGDCTQTAVQGLLQQAAGWRGGSWLRPLARSLTAPGSPLVRTLGGHHGPVYAVAVTPRGDRAVSASADHTLKVWDLASGSELLTLRGHAGRVRAVAVTSDGQRILSGSRDQTLKLWDLDRGAELCTLRGHTASINAVATIGDGRRAISAASDGTLRVWDLGSGAELRVLRGHTGSVRAVAVVADGRHAVSASEEGALRLWDLESGAELRALRGQGRLRAVAVTPDGHRAVSGSWEGNLEVWDLASGTRLRTLTGHTGPVNAVTLTSDGRLIVSGSRDRTIRVWSLESGEEVCAFGHAGRIRALAAVGDRRQVVSASYDGTLKVWDLETGAGPQLPCGHPGRVNAAALTLDGRLAISGGSDGALILWDAQRAVQLREIRGHGGGVNAVAWIGGERLAISGSDDHTLRVWDVENGTELSTLRGHGCRVDAVAVSKDGRLALSGASDGSVRVWDLRAGVELWAWRAHASRVRAVALLEHRHWALSGSSDSLIRVWDIETGAKLRTLGGHAGGVSALAFVGDGRRAVSGSHDGTLKVWDLQRGVELSTLQGHSGRVKAVSVTGDGMLAISSSIDRTLRVWDLETGKEMVEFTGDSGLISNAVAADGRTIMAGEASGPVHFLRLEAAANGCRSRPLGAGTPPDS